MAVARPAPARAKKPSPASGRGRLAKGERGEGLSRADPGKRPTPSSRTRSGIRLLLPDIFALLPPLPARSTNLQPLSPRGRGRDPALLQGWEGEGAGSTIPFIPSSVEQSRDAPVEGPRPAVSQASPVPGDKARDDLTLGARLPRQFGYGTLAVIEGNKLRTLFEHADRKRVLDSL